LLQYLKDDAAQAAIARFGSLVRRGTTRYPMPATAPAPRTVYEAQAVLQLARAGASIPALIVPISTRRSIIAELGSYAGGPSQLTLEGNPFYPVRPFVIPDPESEAMTFGAEARARIQNDTHSPPDALRQLLASGLTSDPKTGREETGIAWERVRRESGFAGITSWFEEAESQAMASVFLAPSPIIRSTTSSVLRAFDYGWQIADSVETAFDAVGIHLLLHSELLGDDTESFASRRTLNESLVKLYRDPNPRNFPVISIKILDQSKALSCGPDASVKRRNLSELLVNAAEAVHLAGGLLVVHNFGVWVLGPLDCGADIVGFRGTGRTLELDMIFTTPEFPRVRHGTVAGKLVTPRASAGLRVPPFDPVRLANTRMSELKALWKEEHAFPVADHVTPGPLWTWDKHRQRAFRTLQVTSALLQLGNEFRAAATGLIPIRDSVRDRVERMQEHDAMHDLCPSI